MTTIGIDLGTTNSVAAIDGKVLGIGVGGSPILPSVVSFPPSRSVVVGAEAKHRKTIDPENTIFSAKRIIGRKWLSSDAAEFRRRYPFELVEKNGYPLFVTRMGEISPTEIATTILKQIHGNDEVAKVRHLAKTVITVPPLFGIREMDATIKAATNAGFSDVRIIDEPSATAEAYLADITEPTEIAVVYDLGGGTFDLAVLDCQTSPAQVIAHEGDLYLGGDDIDFALADWVANQVLESNGWDLKSHRPVYANLLDECERAKVRLSTGGEPSINLQRVDPAAPVWLHNMTLPADVVESIVSGFVRRTFSLCDEILHKAGVKVEQVDRVFLAGGLTQLPQIQSGVASYFGKDISQHYNPMHVVAIGASLIE